VSHRIFIERLHSCLDEIGLPEQQAERAEAFAKLLSVPRFKAEAILSGHILFDDPLITQLAEELEVSVAWLSGKDDK